MLGSHGIQSLFITRWRPHTPDGGAALRNLQNIRALAAFGPVDVVSIGRPESCGPVEGIRNWTHFQIEPRRRRIPGIWVFQANTHPLIRRYRHHGALEHLSKTLETACYDIAVVEEIALSEYIPVLKAAGLRTVFDAHNVEVVLRHELGKSRGIKAGLLNRFRLRLMHQRLFAVERRAVLAADQVWACSTLDAAELERLYTPVSPVAIIPNTVNVVEYQCPPFQQALANDTGRTPLAPNPVKLVYIGNYSYYPNEDAALRITREILPALRARGVDASVTLIGRDPTPAMLAAATSDPGVTVTGAVSSILPFLAQACILVFPIALGSGTRLKILEAFAAGRPVVSTAKGAEGIEVTDGQDILLRESPEDIANAALGLWRDPAAVSRQIAAALDLVRKRYSWEVAQRQIWDSLRPILPELD